MNEVALDRRIQEMNRDQPYIVSFMTFENRTCYDIEVIHKDNSRLDVDNNEETVYEILRPNQYIDVVSNSGLAWIFRECMSKVQMLVEGKKVFTPTAWPPGHERGNIYTKTIKIHTPVLDLRQICLIKVASTRNITKEDVMKFEIPTTLQTELIQLILNKPKGDFKY